MGRLIGNEWLAVNGTKAVVISCRNFARGSVDPG
jgi:hypothetical protein